MFNEAELAEVVEEGSRQYDTDDTAPDQTKQSKATRGRKPLPPDLPRVRMEHDLSEAEQLCPCGCQRTIIDEDSSE